MVGAFALSATLVLFRWADVQLLVFGVVGILAALARILVAQLSRQRALTAPLNRSQAKRLEIAFAVPSLIFATCLGAFSARVLTLPVPEAHMLTVCLVVGYCAGVATGAGLRPNIAVPTMAAAVSPAIFVALLKFDAIYVATSVILFAFFLGGVHTILTRYSAVKAEIGKRLTFGTLARQDGLTALPNRLALREYFDENASLSAPQRLVAVHYLDLDGFKPVNDSYGHSTGDALLAAVAERLNGVIRNGDIVARLGGDEFALLQFGLNRPEEAQIMSRRANGALEQPFMIGGHHIHISVSIGTVTRQVCNSDLDEMLALADRQLYIAKRLRSEVGERAA
jgi:diguanylate cyclase (GGDEF)-like protein